MKSEGQSCCEETSIQLSVAYIHLGRPGWPGSGFDGYIRYGHGLSYPFPIKIPDCGVYVQAGVLIRKFLLLR